MMSAKRIHRLDWIDYFLRIAREAASRSTCDRKSVGAVIVRDRTIISTGYNGVVSHVEHCNHEAEGTLSPESTCEDAVHAEANAIIQAARNGVCIEGARIYTTLEPCYYCTKLIVNSGINTIIYEDEYRSEKRSKIYHMLLLNGVALWRFKREDGIELIKVI